LVAIHAGWNEIWLFGEKTREIWYNDGSTPFVPINGSTLSIGCKAPYSIQWIRDSFYWLNNIDQVVKSNGNSYVVVSDAIGNFLTESFEQQNIIGDYLYIDDKHLYVLTNSDYSNTGLTLVYDTISNEWQGKWGRWSGEYNRYRGQSYIKSDIGFLIGDYANGKIYFFGNTYQDDGGLLRSSWLTGWIDHDTLLRKRSFQLRLRILRGEAQKTINSVIEPCQLMVRWRDDGYRVFGNVHYIDLGKIGDYEYYVSLNRLGIYRMRQYEFSITDNAPCIMASAEELIEEIPL
jgi:hypothetical protein